MERRSLRRTKVCIPRRDCFNPEIQNSRSSNTVQFLVGHLTFNHKTTILELTLVAKVGYQAKNIRSPVLYAPTIRQILCSPLPVFGMVNRLLKTTLIGRKLLSLMWQSLRPNRSSPPKTNKILLRAEDYGDMSPTP